MTRACSRGRSRRLGYGGSIPPRRKKKNATPPPLTQQTTIHYASSQAWAWDNLDEWPKTPPLESLHLTSEPSGLGGDEEEPSAKRFLDWANFGNAIGTWNVRDRRGQWACERGQWIVVRADLGRGEDEDEHTVGVTIACWEVEEGYAVFLTRLGEDSRRVPSIMGLAWPEEWKTETLWYGE